MPPGYQQALIEGNPRNAAPYTFRARIQAHWRAMPHYHPTDEHITVLAGSCFVGVGDMFAEGDALELPSNSFITITAGTVHYFFTKAACEIQVHGIGPQRIIYVNPSYDPRNCEGNLMVKRVSFGTTGFGADLSAGLPV